MGNQPAAIKDGKSHHPVTGKGDLLIVQWSTERSRIMKFMASWKVHEDKRHQVLEFAAQMGLEEYKKHHGPAVKLIGRWHDIVRFRGTMIAETEDLKALDLWLLKWTDVCDFEVTAVIDDDEVYSVMERHLSEKK
jgi:hypothetical protein